jgi:hypothetical protein
VADEVRGDLARKIQERESESEALIEQPTDPVSKAQDKERELQGWTRGSAALIWTVAIVVGIATGSVPLGLAAMVVGVFLLQVFIRVRRATA